MKIQRKRAIEIAKGDLVFVDYNNVVIVDNIEVSSMKCSNDFNVVLTGIGEDLSRGSTLLKFISKEDYQIERVSFEDISIGDIIAYGELWDPMSFVKILSYEDVSDSRYAANFYKGAPYSARHERFYRKGEDQVTDLSWSNTLYYRVTFD